MKQLTIIVENIYFTPQSNWSAVAAGKDDRWRNIVNMYLREHKPLIVRAYPEHDIFRDTFIEPHLGSDGYLKKEDFNLLYLAEWEGEQILYALIDGLVKPSKEVEELWRKEEEARIAKLPDEWKPYKRKFEGNYYEN